MKFNTTRSRAAGLRLTAALLLVFLSLPGVGSAEVATVRLIDYFYPTNTRAAWNYLQSRENGTYDARVVKVLDASYSLNLFGTENGKVVDKHTNVVCMTTFSGKLSGDKMIGGSTLYSKDFYGTGAAYALYGFVDLIHNHSIRFSPGAVFPETLPIRRPVSVKTDVFSSGREHGPDATVTAEVLEKTSVSVPAGVFPDCIHLRFTVAFEGGPTGIAEEWWAKGVGMVRAKYPRVKGPDRITKLHSYSLPPESAIGFVKANGKFGLVSMSGPPAVKVLFVKNTGNKSIKGLTVSLTGPSNFTCQLLTTGKVLPGKAAQIKVTFDSTDLKGRRAILKATDLGNPDNTCSIKLVGSSKW